MYRHSNKIDHNRDRVSKRVDNESKIREKQALILHVWKVSAIIPCVSEK